MTSTEQTAPAEPCRIPGCHCGDLYGFLEGLDGDARTMFTLASETVLNLARSLAAAWDKTRPVTRDDNAAPLAAALKLLELKSTAELEHVIGCERCYVFDAYDGGPHWCREFDHQFRR